MALLTLLLALIIERTVELNKKWQLYYWIERWYDKSSLFLERTSASFILVVATVPALVAYISLSLAKGVMFGLFSLILWVIFTLLCIGCVHYRALYKHYLLSVCHQDTQASYHIASQLLDVECLKVNDESMLASRVGRQLTWINYRFYCALLLMVIVGGPVLAVFYATLRSLDIMMFKKDIMAIPLVTKLLFIIDWLPARIVAFAYVLIGNFSHAIPVWLSLCLNIKLPAYDVVSKVAMASEQIDKKTEGDGVCMTLTCRLVQLAKRTLVLMVSAISLLTIFGVLI